MSDLYGWKISLYGIQWDDGKGEYDVSELPENLEVKVEEEDEQGAIERALTVASDEFGSLIDGTEQIVACAVYKVIDAGVSPQWEDASEID